MAGEKGDTMEIFFDCKVRNDEGQHWEGVNVKAKRFERPGQSWHLYAGEAFIEGRQVPVTGKSSSIAEPEYWQVAEDN